MSDVISSLPSHLVEKIYTFLPDRGITVTSALSHHWYEMWSKYKNVYMKFEFDRYYPDTSDPPYDSVIKSQETRFLTMLNTFIQKRIGFDTRHHRFESCFLYIDFNNMHSLQQPLEDWVRLVLIRDIPQFSLNLVSKSFFRLPYFESEYITSLTLKGCMIKKLVLPNLGILVIRNCRFGKLSLESIFQDLGKVKDVKLSFCEKISRLHLSNLPSLTNLQCLWCQDVDSVIINAPALRKFCFACQEQIKGSFRLDCNALEELKITGVNLNEKFAFGNLISALPNLQMLSLNACVGRLDFSCGSLTKLELQNVHFIGECSVHTPKLQNLTSHYGPLFVPSCAPSHLKSNITFEVQSMIKLSSSLFVPKVSKERLIAWRDFLFNLTGQKDTRLVICLQYEDLCSRELLELDNMDDLESILENLLQKMTRIEASKREMMNDKILAKILRDIIGNCNYSLLISMSLIKLSDLVEINNLASQGS